MGPELLTQSLLRLVGKQLPRPKVSMVHSVEDNTHALPGGDESRNSNEPAQEWQNSPSPTSVAEGDEQIGKETSKYAEDAETASEDDARSVAVADGPSDEVRVCLLAKRVLDSGGNRFEGGWVCRVLQGVQDCLSLASRKIQFTWSTIGHVDGDDTRYFVSVWLCGDC